MALLIELVVHLGMNWLNFCEIAGLQPIAVRVAETADANSAVGPTSAARQHLISFIAAEYARSPSVTMREAPYFFMIRLASVATFQTRPHGRLRATTRACPTHEHLIKMPAPLRGPRATSFESRRRTSGRRVPAEPDGLVADALGQQILDVAQRQYRTYIITTRRMTSGELLKYRNGLLMRRG